ncbi:hypothetical protein Franean1_2600 [Parafrankia sp. EAN1pec]|nr:hypothetical protein Franean1_2600 [Frankia sp. EAN1pec]
MCSGCGCLAVADGSVELRRRRERRAIDEGGLEMAVAEDAGVGIAVAREPVGALIVSAQDDLASCGRPLIPSRSIPPSGPSPTHCQVANGPAMWFRRLPVRTPTTGERRYEGDRPARSPPSSRRPGLPAGRPPCQRFRSRAG